RKEIWSVDRNVALADTGSLESYLERFSYAQPRFGVASLGAFAGIGLLLVVIGVFSVMAYTVSLQTHEIGIRIALGAQQSNVLQMVLRKGMRLIAAGILLGLVSSFALTRLLASQIRSEEHTSEIQSRSDLVCRLLLEKKKVRNHIVVVTR